jgi:hypothetical protein
MRITPLILSLGLFTGGAAFAEVVRPAPLVAFPSVDGRQRTLKSFAGQPVIVLLADSPKRGDFRDQLKEMEKSFDRLAVRKTVVAAAFKKGDSGEIRSDVPVVTLPEGASVCSAFQMKGKFSIALIGPDGNLDYITDKVLNINRILEVMQNSYEVQKAAHR